MVVPSAGMMRRILQAAVIDEHLVKKYDKHNVRGAMTEGSEIGIMFDGGFS